MEFSLLYFSGNGSTTQADKYNLFLETAQFADRNNFSAIWMPERHFHAFGGLYPNPALTGSALATITDQIELRSGSVVLPLQHPVRVAEEWAVVDNLSKGRVALSFASGWHADDFLLAPENYCDRKALMWHEIETVKQLWRGESVEFVGGTGNAVEATTYPRPIQAELPVWVTAKTDQTFINAGQIGANVLTSLIYETTDDLVQKISLYRDTLSKNGYNPNSGKVAVMLHTFIGEDWEQVKEEVREPFCNYLNTHFSLIERLAKTVDFEVNPDTLTPADRESLLSFAFEQYLNYRVMIGTVETCRDTIEHMKEIGVNEIACMIDFGLDINQIMPSLNLLQQLKSEIQSDTSFGKYSSLSLFS